LSPRVGATWLPAHGEGGIVRAFATDIAIAFVSVTLLTERASTLQYSSGVGLISRKESAMSIGTKSIKITDAAELTDHTLSEAALDLVVGGRMKLPGPNVSGPYGGAGGQTIDIQWAGHPNYLSF
jgi:hypothetical protein